MMRSKWAAGQTFAAVIGVTDGILTALTLASGHFASGTRPGMGLSLRIAAGSALCGIFVFYTAEYARLRRRLVDAEKQLNLWNRGHFATTRLGHRVRIEAVFSAVVSSSANFLGALLPLWCGTLLPGPAVLAILPSILALGVLGFVLAMTIHGNRLYWTSALMISGLLLAYVGTWLNIA